METYHPTLPKYLDEEVSPECRELLSSLPKETGWVTSYLYQYEGFWYPSRHFQGVVNCQKNFRAQDTDILLVTNPKSGTTWLKAVLFSLVNRKRYSVSSEDHPLLTNNPQILVPSLDIDLYFKDQNPNLSSFTSPRLFSTHLPNASLPKSVHDSACKIVYLCRDPKDMFISLWHFIKKLRPPTNGTPLEEMFDKFCKGVSPYGPFWEHVLGYWEHSLQNPEKVLFLKYEHMKEKPGDQLRKLADFLGCPFSMEEEMEGVVDIILQMCSFEKLRNLEVNKEGKLPNGVENKIFFRRGEVGDWKNHLTPEMTDRIEQINKEISGSGLKLNYNPSMATSQSTLPKYLDEEEVSQECREFLSSFPKETGWHTIYLYQYEGFWYPLWHLQGAMNFQKHFQAQDTDILLVTNPKSGTTWLKAILFTLVNRNGYLISSEDNPLLTSNPHILVPFLDNDLYLKDQNPDLSSFKSPRLFSTHLPNASLPKSVHDSACKIVYLCREPKDMLVSLWYFINKLSPPTKATSLEDMFDKFCKGENPYGPFWDHVLGYWEYSQENPEKVLFLKYEDMKEEPAVHLRKLAAFLGCPFSMEEETEGLVDDILTMCSFEKLSKVNKEGKLLIGIENKAFFRSGGVGDWKNHLTEEMAGRIKQINEEKLHGSGLKL